MIARPLLTVIIVYSFLIAHTPVWAAQFADEQELGTKAYEDGDYNLAKSTLLPLAELNHAKALNIIGLMHKYGRGFSINLDTACEFYERAANLDYPPAMYNLSRCYELGLGKSIDHKKAYEWMMQSANDGFVKAMLYLVYHEQSTDEESLHWLKTAAGHGSKFAAAKLWLNGHREDAPDFSLLDELCVIVWITWLDQGIYACDE